MNDIPPEEAAFARRLLALERSSAERIAQRLHNELGQTLTAMRIEFVNEARFAEPALAARHERVNRLLDQAIRELRAVMAELRPRVLEERGLVDALDGELRQRRSAAPEVGLELDFDESIAERRWDSDVEYAAFVVAREAIDSALRHAGARRLQVRLQGDKDSLQIEVEDDGRGLTPAPPAGQASAGMAAMHERCRAIGARLEWQSAGERGTTVRLAWRRSEA